MTLVTCNQTDLERWLTSDDVRHRREARHFVCWALSQQIARDLTFPAMKWNGPSQAMDGEARWATARRLVHDAALKPEDRLAGLLLLLSAQWPAATTVAVKWQRAAAGEWGGWDQPAQQLTTPALTRTS
ncbi:hypothetical protein ACFRQM_46050 [Streptomyces sp. NPDC056831]|uniref:hypothetical protein n=1 Tax=Streptomyces sp. NPDC056831 TaxID=3345954 RepID=UPI003688BCA5